MDLNIIPKDITEQNRFTIIEYHHRIINLGAHLGPGRQLFQTIQIPEGLSGDVKSIVRPYHVPKGSEEIFFKL